MLSRFAARANCSAVSEERDRQVLANQYQQAARAISATKLQPDNADAYGKLASVYKKLNMLNESAAASSKAAELYGVAQPTRRSNVWNTSSFKRRSKESSASPSRSLQFIPSAVNIKGWTS